MTDNNAQETLNADGKDIPEVTEIESLCMNCHEDVSTRNANTC